MKVVSHLNFDIKAILAKESIITAFQPIVSLKRKKIVGLEALTRGYDTANDTMIAPNLLFEAADEADATIELDRLCRRTAIKNFRKIKNFKDMVLFVNLNTAVLNQDGELQMLTKLYADQEGVSYCNIAMEIVESAVENNSKLIEVIEKYRELGFFVALDDFGALHSNLNRLVITKPDIIKIDRCLVNDVSKSYYQRSIIKSIIELAKTIGSLTLAEGLEEEEDIFTCYEMGIDLYQGFYFARPGAFDEIAVENCINRILTCADKIKRNIETSIHENKEKHKENQKIIEEVERRLNKLAIKDFFQEFQETANENDSVQCIYLLDSNGTQIGPTICGCGKKSLKQNHFFRPAEELDDHSLKDYYYYISHLGLERFYTNPYISLASGQLCRTASFRTNAGAKNYIVCIDFIEQKLNAET